MSPRLALYRQVELVGFEPTLSRDFNPLLYRAELQYHEVVVEGLEPPKPKATELQSACVTQFAYTTIMLQTGIEPAA